MSGKDFTNAEWNAYQKARIATQQRMDTEKRKKTIEQIDQQRQQVIAEIKEKTMEDTEEKRRIRLLQARCVDFERTIERLHKEVAKRRGNELDEMEQSMPNYCIGLI